LEVTYLCDESQKPLPDATAFPEKLFGAALEKTLQNTKKAIPYWAQPFARAHMSTIALPVTHILHPIQCPIGLPCCNCKRASYPNGFCGPFEVAMDLADQGFRCIPKTADGIYPCLHKRNGENKITNTCGMQRIIKCSKVVSSESCEAAYDLNEDSTVHLKVATPITVQFEAQYAFKMIKVYYLPDDSDLTKKKNCFDATIQCLQGSSWRTVGHIKKDMPKQRKSGWFIVKLSRCTSTSWRLANIKPLSADQTSVQIADFLFVGPRAGFVSKIPPIDNDPCGISMSITPETKVSETYTYDETLVYFPYSTKTVSATRSRVKRAVITTTWPWSKVKCDKKKASHEVISALSDF
jgi:hypothetical protein